MTASTITATPRLRSAVATVVLATLASAVGAALLGLGALALGATAGFPPLQPFVAMPFAAAGTLVGIGGWLLVVRFVRRPAVALRVLVPLALLVSWIPDVALLVIGFIPGTTPVAVIALMLMHLVAAAAAVVAGRRIAPAR